MLDKQKKWVKDHKAEIKDAGVAVGVVAVECAACIGTYCLLSKVIPKKDTQAEKHSGDYERRKPAYS